MAVTANCNKLPRSWGRCLCNWCSKVSICWPMFSSEGGGGRGEAGAPSASPLAEAASLFLRKKK